MDQRKLYRRSDWIGARVRLNRLWSDLNSLRGMARVIVQAGSEGEVINSGEGGLTIRIDRCRACYAELIATRVVPAHVDYLGHPVQEGAAS